MSLFQHLTRRYIVPAVTKSGGLRLVFDAEADSLLDTATTVHCIVIADLDSDRIFEYGPGQIAGALAHLARADYLTGLNIQKYDLPLLRRLYDWAPSARTKIIDMLIASRLILPNLSDLDDRVAAMGGGALKKLRGRHSVEAWGARLGIAKVGAEIEDFSVWTPELQARCVGDDKITKALWHFLQPDGYSPQAMELEYRVNAICNRIEADGVPFDDAAAARLERQWSAECSELATLLRNQFPDMNPNSRTQVARQLEARGWIPEERTEKTKQAKIDDELLETIPSLYPEFAGLAKFHILRRRIAQLSKGTKAWRKHVGADGHIRGGIVHIGTPHSRAAHSGPNLAQVPNPKRGTPFATECRNLFRAPASWVFVTADQATLQDRAFAHYLTEFDGGAYAKAFLSGVDQHWKGAAILDLVAEGTTRDKRNRTHEIAREGAKSFRYAFLFGCQSKRAGKIINKIVRNLQHVDPAGGLQQKFFAEAARPSENALRRVGERALDKFEAGTPGLRQLRQALQDHARRHGWLPGLDGRRVPARALYSTLNFIVTSAEAIVCKRWLVQVHDELCARFHYGWNGDMVIPLWIHDELACCCRAEIAAEVGEIMVRHAKKAGEFYGLKVPLDADYKVGRSWAGELAPDDAQIIDEAPPQSSTVPAHQINWSTPPERDFPRTTVGAAATEPLTTPKAGVAPPPTTDPPGTELPPHAGAEFLAGMFGGSTEHAAFVCSLLNNDDRVDGRADERFVTTRDKGAVAAFARKWDLPKRGIYYCVSTLVPNARRRSKETLAELNCLHSDLDFKNLEASPDEVRQALRELEYPPSLVVFSGHGLHCLWLFKEGLEATPVHVARVEELLRRLTEYLGADPQAAECARLLRLPGSHNTKHSERIEVVAEIFEPRRRYALDALAAWLEAAPAPRLRRRTESKGNGGDDENPFIAAGRGFKPPIDVEARLAAMRYQGVGDSAIHGTQLSVSAALINRGTPVDEVVAILLAATRTAAGDKGSAWNWEREEHELRRMCRTWIEKNHPEGDGAPAAQIHTAPLHPYHPRPFSEIPPRRWLHAGHYIRRHVVMTVAPGGYGKTSLVLANAIEMATGLGLLGATPTEGALRVAYWNAEDPDEEIERRIAAVCLHHKLDPAALAGHLYLGSRITGGRRIAELDRTGNVVLHRALLDAVRQFIADNHIDCAIFDPLIAFHRVPESDNVAMEQVIEAFGQIAEATDSCIELSQHTRKSQGTPGEITADDSRGASAIVYAGRSVRILNRMTSDEAELAKIEPELRRLYLRLARDKANMTPPEKAKWVRLVSVDLPNGDKVQAVEAWAYPEADAGVTADDVAWARAEVARNAYRTRPESPDWFGHALAERLRLNIGIPGAPRSADEKGNRRRVNAILRTWLARGVLQRERRRDAGNRKAFEYFQPGSGDGSEDPA